MKNNTDESVIQLENTAHEENMEKPSTVYCRTVKKRKKAACFSLVGVLMLEVAVAAVFVDVNNKNDITERALQQRQLLVEGAITTATGSFSGDSDFGFFNGEGVFHFNSGAEYAGSFKENKFEGYGVLKIPVEGEYVGEFNGSQKAGKGTFTWGDGTKYTGEWKDDQMFGEGEYTTPDNICYSGSFQENAFWHGTCSFSNSTGEYLLTYSDGHVSKARISFSNGVEYTGECSDACVTGLGEASFPNGDSYTGSFDEDTRNGSGKYLWSGGDSYDGEWLNDAMCGEGTYSYANGSVATGTFSDNQFTDGKYAMENDIGTYVFTITSGKPSGVELKLKDGTTYNGGMKDGKLTGSASIHYSNGDEYSGEVVDGSKKGSGIYTWTSGAKYDGKWSEDQMNGSGTYYYSPKETGHKLTGTFKNGVPEGQCQYYTNSSTSYKTDWSYGSCVKVYE